MKPLYFLLVSAMSAVFGAPAAVNATPEDHADPHHSDSMLINDTSGAREVAPPRVMATTPVKQAVANPARQPTGALTGRIVYTNGGHGWTAYTTEDGRWYTQRGINNGMVEDLGNIDQMTWFAQYCFNAGATVVAFRPVGYQTNEVVIDNDDPQAQFTPGGAWADSTNAQFFGDASDAVHYRYANISATETAVARYTPDIPEAGFYPVYAWTRDGVDRVEDQLYRITHTGGATEVTINHRRVGKGWIYLGTYYLDAGTASYVEISNKSASTTGTYVIADAIRFGNGMGDIDRGVGISGKSREDEASRYWVQAGVGQGASSDIYDQSSLNDQDDNVSTPTRMTAWMNAESDGAITDRIFLSFHSNAYDPGSLGLYNGNNMGDVASTPNQLRWAEIIASELNTDLSAFINPPLYEYSWPDRVALGLSLVLDRTDIEFGEIRGDRINDEMDATIIEVAAHGNLQEAYLMRDVRVREAIARSSLQAVVKYFDEFGGGSLAFLPAPPRNPAAVTNGNGTITVSWTEPASSSIVGDAATGYVIYRSANGRGFGDPVAINGGATLSHTFTDVSPGQKIYYRVAATNAGGESMAAEPVAVRRSVGFPAQRNLIVNGFDRRDRFQNPTQTAASGMGGPNGSGGTFDRVIPRRINSGDYVVEHAEALAAAGAAFDACSNEAVISGAVSLSDYDSVFWICGEESTTDETFNATERSLVTAYLAGGGHLFASGTEIGWHLEAQGGDPVFLGTTLRTDYVNDDANTYGVSGDAGSILDGITGIDFSPTEHIYDADYPDVIAPLNGAVRIASYSTGGGAGIAYSEAQSTTKVVILGFPFETIRSASIRTAVMTRVVEFFQEDASIGNVWLVE